MEGIILPKMILRKPFWAVSFSATAATLDLNDRYHLSARGVCIAAGMYPPT
jgi:hypothetical protein